ncbi:MAG: DUF4296 domain-containing protein [Bacteroidales bacterium]
MKKSWLLLIPLFLFFSCYNSDAGKERSKQPKPALTVDQMAGVLTDMHLAQSTLKFRQDRGLRHRDSSEHLHYIIFRKHNITQEEFEKSMDYYKHDLKKYDLIYEKVLENLSKLESQLSE